MAGEKALERRVEDAEQATTRVVSAQRERVGQAVPTRTADSARSAEEYARRAMESLSGLNSQRDIVRGYVNSREVQDALARMFSAMSPNPEEAYRAAEAGHEKPSTVVRTQAEARAHSAQELSEAQLHAPPRQQARAQEASSSGDERGFWDKLWDGISAIFDAVLGFLRSATNFILYPLSLLRGTLHDALTDSNAELNEEISSQWLSREYLGNTLHGRFRATPPVLTNESDSYFNTLDEADGPSARFGYPGGSGGHYYPGTNHITVRDNEPPREIVALSDYTEANRRVLIAHEQLHYASWLGGGQNMRWREDGGRPVVRGNIAWLHEGLTELHAQQLTRSHRQNPDYVGYPYETATGFYMQQIVGEDVLRGAYLSGDFTEVRRRMDARLGAGTFDRLTGMERGLDALEFITGKMASAGINFSAWEGNPILAGCFRRIAGLEAI